MPRRTLRNNLLCQLRNSSCYLLFDDLLFTISEIKTHYCLNEKSPVAWCDRALFVFYYILHIYIRALLPYDCRSCNGCHHQYVFTNIVFIDFFCFIRGKDSANRMYNKMNLFIFYAEVQPVFVFATNISTLF